MFAVLLLPLLASALAAVACGAVGSLMLVRRDTYAAGAVSHACFAGLGAAQYLSVVHGAAWATPTLGAMCAAVAAALFLALSPAARTGGSDAALSALWAVGMAVGLVFLAATPDYQGDLLGYLFGSILFVSRADLAEMAVFDLVLLACLALFWRGLLAVSFNAPLMTALGAVMLARLVGIVLVIALLALPALAARRLVRRLAPMMAVAGLLAFASMGSGLLLSWAFDCQPSAPTVFAAAALALAARLLSPMLRPRTAPRRPS